MGAGDARAPGTSSCWDASKLAVLVGVTLAVVAVDLATKLVVEGSLRLHQEIPLVGDYVRLTYIYNPGAAFGIGLGRHSRLLFLALSALALAALGAMAWVTPPHERGRLAAIALICGGALGNLVDRLRSDAGVVDFLDIGVGELRWPVFNLADVAVTTGAVFLALSLWREDGTRR